MQFGFSFTLIIFHIMFLARLYDTKPHVNNEEITIFSLSTTDIAFVSILSGWIKITLPFSSARRGSRKLLILPLLDYLASGGQRMPSILLPDRVGIKGWRYDSSQTAVCPLA
jgi:hypothetical protein